MKRKELLQKSSTVAAVVLAAALMDPGTVQASAGDQSVAANASQVMEQSVETEGEAVSESPGRGASHLTIEPHQYPEGLSLTFCPQRGRSHCRYCQGHR